MAVIKRPHYFNHQFLQEEDFTLETEYHLEMRRRHARLLHTPGVAEGLTVTGTSGATTVTVSPGTALDRQGREIVLLDPQPVPLPTGVTSPSAELYAAYQEQESDQVTAAGVTGNTRITEAPTFAVVVPPTPGPADGVLLARLSLNNGQLSGTPNTAVRQVASSVVDEDLRLRSLSLQLAGQPQASWPRLRCSGANVAGLEAGSLRLDNNREILFQDNGQIRSFDQNHRLVFNRANNRLELHEFGDILFLTGGPTPSEKLRILANGNVGIGVPNPVSPLHVLGGNWDVGTTEGDLKIGDGSFRLKIGVARGGAGAGDVRIRAHGGTNRLMLGGGTTDALVIQGDNVGIGTITPGARLQVEGSIRSPMWRVSQVFRQVQGPTLPVRQFPTGGGVLLVLCSGSGFSPAGARVIGADVRIDNNNVSQMRCFTNEASSHKAFVANPELVGGIAAGTHNLSIVPIAGTSIDFNDFFNVSVIEFPWVQTEFVFVPVDIVTPIIPPFKG